MCMCFTSCGPAGGGGDDVMNFDEYELTQFMRFPNLVMEVGQRLCIDNFLLENKGSEVLVENKAMLTCEGSNLFAHKEGNTRFLVKFNEQYQEVNVEIKPANSLHRAWNIENMEKGAKIVAFGDSVTAFATIGSPRNYVFDIAKEYELDYVQNYAIGGTTGTYMYPGSNIYKEYRTLEDVLDGPRVIKRAVDNNELNDVDYAFIAYGHNDQYFQPPITVEGDDVYNVDNFDNAHSWKGSYRFMVNYLRKANPNIKIILLNCTYSEYYLNDHRPYGHEYDYEDYRIAVEEIAEEMDCKTIDPWNYMKQYFDAYNRKVNYKDVVHITQEGHLKLADYIKKF